MELSERMQEIFQDMILFAQDNRHEYVTPEHFLYILCREDDFRDCLAALGGDADKLTEDLEAFFEQWIDRVPEGQGDYVPELSNDLETIFGIATLHAGTSGRTKIDLLHLFRGLMQLEECHATYYIAKQQVDLQELFLALHRAMADDSDGTAPQEALPAGGRKEQPAGEDWRRYVTCLNDLVLREDQVPLIGREKELGRLMLILCRKEKNNPLLIGEAGVGKTAIAYGFVRRVVNDEVPKALRGAHVYLVDMGSMVAGTQYRGDFEKRMETVLKGIAGEENPIIFLDEIHNIVGAGAVGGGSLDAANILKPFMTDGRIRFIGSTTYEEYKKSFAKNHSLVRRFQNIDVEEPSAEETVRILQGLKPWYEAHHGAVYPDEILQRIVDLSDKYLKDAFRPDKAIDLMDEAGAMLQLAGAGEDATVTNDTIERVLCEFMKVPKETVETDESAMLKRLPDALKTQVFGQDPAIDAVCRSIRLSRAGLNEENKPVACMLFVGPTGVGKTEVARVLADTLGLPLTRFDMSEYMEKHAVAKFLGAPAGYVGYEDGGRLTDVIRKKPNCVLLLDEIEKAHPDIMNVLLQIMDYATVTDSQGVKADFRQVILIMTSNAGASDLAKAQMGFGGAPSNIGAVDEAVKRIFSPEFRNRLTQIITFNALTDEMAARIVEKQLAVIADRLQARGVTITFSEKLRDAIRREGTSAEYGARQLQRVIDRKIKPPLADWLLDEEQTEGISFELDVDENGSVKIPSNR